MIDIHLLVPLDMKMEIDSAEIGKEIVIGITNVTETVTSSDETSVDNLDIGKDQIAQGLDDPQSQGILKKR
jgi:hypothetical protein